MIAENKNDYIIEYCKKYIADKKSPNFAILIKGNWGVGKTFFINKLLKDCEENILQKKQVIKLSLYGVETTEEIDLKIFEALHPIISSKPAKYLGAVLRTAMKLGTKINLDNECIDSITLSSGTIQSQDSKPFNKKDKLPIKKLFIIDDIERSFLSPMKLLGYFSEFIIDSDIKVIFIGNENKILPNPNECEEFNKIKEKVIGMEFEILPSYQDAFDHFMTDLAIKDDKKQIYLDILIPMAENLKVDNLRIVWEALYNLNYLNEILFSKNIETSDTIKIITIFLLLFIRKNQGKNDKEENILRVIEAYFNKNYNFLCEDLETRNDFVFNTIGYIPLLNIWEEIIYNGNYNLNYILDSYNKEKQKNLSEQNIVKPLFYLIMNWRSLSRDDFKKTILTIKKDFKDGKYLNIGELLHFANIMIIFSKWKLIPDSIDNIKEQINYVFEEFRNKIELCNDWVNLQMGYAGFAYNNDIEEVNDIFKYVHNVNDKIIKEKINDLLLNEIDQLNESNIDLFNKNIQQLGNYDKYRNMPIMQMINIDNLYNKLKVLPISKQEEFIISLKIRYSINDYSSVIKKIFLPDFQNLKSLLEKYNNDREDLLYNPSEIIKSNLIDELTGIITCFQKMENNN